MIDSRHWEGHHHKTDNQSPENCILQVGMFESMNVEVRLGVIITFI